MRHELENAIQRLESQPGRNEGDRDNDFNDEDIRQNFELLTREYESVQNQLERAGEDIQVKEKCIKELKKSMNTLIGDKRKNSNDVEKELARLLGENERLRHHSLQLQRVFQEREAELLGELDKYNEGDQGSDPE